MIIVDVLIAIGSEFHLESLLRFPHEVVSMTHNKWVINKDVDILQ